MKHQRRIKHQRSQLSFSESELKQTLLEFLAFRLQPQKKGFGQIIYNNSIPMFDSWFKNRISCTKFSPK
jgi:hypothetical protein